MRIGLHTSTSGSLENSAILAHGFGANTFQIFSASPRQWRAAKPVASEVKRFAATRAKLGLEPLVVHTNYLANLASLDPDIRAKSVASFRGEMERAIMLDADFLVLHPGNYKGQSLEQGIAAFVLGLAEAAEGLTFARLTVLLENTVGSGHQIGSRFEQLHMIRDLARRETRLPLGYCLDTCHLLASGYDVASESGLEKTTSDASHTLGLDLVKVIHANDSRGGLNSHLDRHENIGKGQIGEAGFARILRHKAFRDKPFILETPFKEDGDEKRDVDALKRLAGLL